MRVRSMTREELDELTEAAEIAVQGDAAPLYCIQCKDSETFKLVCPTGWPVLTTAVVCFKCGATRGYLDERLTPREERFAVGHQEKLPDKPRREVVVRGGVSHRILDDVDAIRELVLMGLENGLSIDDVAVTANVSRHYVHAVATQTGIIRKRSQA